MVKRIKKRVAKAEPELAEGSESEDEAGALAGGLASADDDEFVQYTATIMQWVLNHRGLILATVVGIIALAVGVAGIQYKQTTDRETASQSFVKAAEAYREATEAQRPKPGETAETPSAEDTRVKVEAARAAFERTRQDHADQPVSVLAALGSASALVELGKAGEAIALYDDVLGRSDVDAFSRAVVLQGKAVALENAGKADDAIGVWRQLEQHDAKAFGLTASIQIGRILEVAGKVDEARAHFTKTAESYSDALEELGNRVLKNELEYRTARLGKGT